MSNVGADLRSDRVGESRCGRRGEPGSSETILCLQHEPLHGSVSPWIAATLELLFRRRALPIWLGQTILLQARRRATRERGRNREQENLNISPDAPFVVTQPRRRN
jgi:preprotein translocase subunit SecA